ncbi:MAG: DUF502 domain-containing protein [Burkholderiales bacterium]|nr:MAG: DUF502 domain-containing protein [Burkholderiales bacterium]
MTMIRRWFVAGLLIWVPLVITVWVLLLVVDTMDQTLELLPPAWRPDRLLGFRVPGMGVLLTLLVVLLTGVLVANILGQRLVLIWESILGRIPIVRSIYSSVKQVSDTLFSGSGHAFRKALLVQYPRAGVWTIAFQTGVPAAEVGRHVDDPMISVYVPTTPNPTSGFFLMMKRSEVIELAMSVDDALKYVISMGVVAPRERAPALPAGPSE